MKRNIKRVISALVLLSAVIMAANLSTFIRVGVDRHYREIRMPLYVKWTEFLARHYEYKRISEEITAGCKTDEEKILAILKWTRENLKDVPAGMPVCDDHILYTIIRGYALPEQFQDVFTNLCAYSGIPAFYEIQYDKSHKVKYAISFVRLNGKWRVFDAYYGKYFRAAGGEIAAVEDIRNDPSLIEGEDIGRIAIRGVPYRDFYCNIGLEQIKKGITLRPYRQMPLHRIVYEARKALGLERESEQELPVL